MRPSPDLRRLASRWRRRERLAALLAGLAAAAPAAVLALALLEPPSAALVALVLLAGLPSLTAAVAEWRRPGLDALARHLDRRLPAAGEGSELLLTGEDALPPLARLQRRRTAAAVGAAAPGVLLPSRHLRRAALACALALPLAAALLLVGSRGEMTVVVPRQETVAPAPLVGPGLVLESIELVVEPPAYTGLPVRQVAGLALSAPAGSTVRWRLRGAGEVAAGRVEGAGEEPVAALAGDRGWTIEGSSRLERSVLVRATLERDGAPVLRSSWGRWEAVPDTPPTLTLLAPAEHLLERAPERLGALDLEIEASDDHGLAAAALVLTVAAGSGELVTFHDQRRPLPVPRGAVRHRFRERLDLAALGLGPGGELYARIEAADGRRPAANVARSSTVIVRVRGGGGESVGLGSGLPTLAAPEMVRSQRQIILDTEQLLRDAPGLAAAEVTRRSAAIGFDQRALRLRYGALLGDEEVGGEHDDRDDEHGAEGDRDGAALGSSADPWAAVPDEVVHRHDTAESATFFPDQVRSTLRQALAAMWEAEGDLRGGEPAAALPHENRALELLKRVQQASRVYVQRVGFAPPPLVPEERRLTGDLSELRDLARRWEESADGGASEPAAALAGLAAGEAGETGQELLPGLQAARTTLARQALEEPAAVRDLEAVERLLELLAAGEVATADEREAARRALWRSLPPPPRGPARGVGGVAPPGTGYRERLPRGDR